MTDSETNRSKIYCVVPEVFGPELLKQLQEYYADDPDVEVIVDRRKQDRRSGAKRGTAEVSRREVRDRRCKPVMGEFPDLEPSDG